MGSQLTWEVHEEAHVAMHLTKSTWKFDRLLSSPARTLD